jgi:uncharacterized protein (TIGR02246 family)
MRIRRCLMLTALCTAAGVVLAQGTATRAADEAAIREVARQFIVRRDNRDEDGLRSLLTETADQRVTSGRMRSGREAVISGSLGTTQDTGGKRSITFESIRFVGDDVAIADGPYSVLGRNDGTDLLMRTTMVLHRIDGQWKIEAIRNVRAPE